MVEISNPANPRLKIYLARHGQDEDNVNGILNGQRDQPLTEKGIEQAKEVAQKIKAANIIFEKVYSSPLQRAYKTAEIITDTLGIEKPVKMETLIERNFGEMTGQSNKNIKERCAPDILETETVTYFLSPKGAETFPDLIERAEKVIREIEFNHKTGNILLVTHGDIGKMIYAEYFKLTKEDDWKKVLKAFHFGNSDLLLLAQDSKPEDSPVFRIKQYNI